ncbi:MAG: outer membrane lipid asymmetry maintenance protein MlaD [Gammaproteobacteria bacterium]|jgi:phospholipid/cholesterol/gamma-HCH transport system substrate-binding protein
MMQSRAVEIVVGLFIAAGLAALFMLAMKVSNLSTFDTSEGYTLKARFDAIGGLKVRAPVTVAGVKVGRVSSIELDEQDFRALVTLTLSAEALPLQEVDARGEPVEAAAATAGCAKPKPAEQCVTSLYDDASASILTAGLLGEQYVGIEPGGGGMRFLQPGDEIRMTQSSIALEQIIGQFLFSKADEAK